MLSNPKKKKKRLECCFMCRQSIQHNFEVGQYNKAFYQMEDPPMQGLIKNPPKGLKIDPFPTQQTNTKQTLNPPKSLSGVPNETLPCHLEVPTAQRLAPLFVRVLESATKSPSVSNPGIYSLTRWGWGGSLAGHHGKKGLLCLAL